MEKERVFRIAIIWLAILILATFMAGSSSRSDPVNLTVLPQVPREGEPVIVNFNINNPSLQAEAVHYQLYIDGQTVIANSSRLPPQSSDYSEYAYRNQLRLGEQVNFVVKSISEEGEHGEGFSIPPYPPQVWTSFVSFASFSTSVMGFMGTMSYYKGSFGMEEGPNVGLICALVLIGLLVFVELTPLEEKGIIIGRLRIRFSRLLWILLLIFIGMAYTRVVLVLVS